MKILTLCLLAASASVALARTELPLTADRVTQACGAPESSAIMTKDSDPTDFRVRVYTYPKVSLIFGENSTGGSAFVGAKVKPKAKTLDLAGATKLMPCLSAAMLQLPASDSVRQTAAANEYPLSVQIIFWLVGALAVLFFGYEAIARSRRDPDQAHR